MLTQSSQILTQNSAILDDHIKTLSGRADRIVNKENVSAEISTAFTQMISDTSASLRNTFNMWKAGLLQNEEKMLNSLRDSWGAQMSEVCMSCRRLLIIVMLAHLFHVLKAVKSVQTLSTILESISRDVKDHTEKERTALLSLNTLTDTAVGSEVRRNQERFKSEPADILH